MPSATPRACPVMGCRHVCPCPVHRTVRADRHAEHTRILGSYRWRVTRDAFRRAHPLCGEAHDGQLHATHSRCVQAGRLTPAECVDHRWPLSKGGAPFDPRNLMSLCRRCNSRKADTVTGDGVTAVDAAGPVLA